MAGPTPPPDAIRIDDTMVVWFVNGRAKWAFVPAPPPAPPPPPAGRPVWVKALTVAAVVLVGFVLLPLAVVLLPVGAPAGIATAVVMTVRMIRRRRAARP